MHISEIARFLKEEEKKTLTLEKGEYLIHAGDFPHEIFLVCSGTVHLEYKGQRSSRREGQNPGLNRQIWGLKEAILKVPYACSAVAKESLLVNVYPWECIYQISDENPGLRLKLMEMIAQEINQTALHFE
ncbi:MAG: Crp/Fnr family transcriptional regulator [Bacteroidia bacterium]|nr:Crp/Fnr family transcriptional regulator [Bacteroidia bacterium]